ncbi:MAG: type I-E CRISPR-associated protein Cse2/CasB [Candidatus Bipolaricaulia bacterium]
MSLDSRQKSFVGYLLSLAREGHEDRGALADLRSGLGKEPSEMARVHKHVAPYLAESNCDDRWYYLTATLFGSFPKHRGGRSVGAAFKPLRTHSASMEARFVALLSAHPDDLDDHLRHAVSLLESSNQPIDWFQLLDDLIRWDCSRGPVQLRWARDFYRSNAGQTGPSIDTTNDGPPDQEEEENHA